MLLLAPRPGTTCAYGDGIPVPVRVDGTRRRQSVPDGVECPCHRQQHCQNGAIAEATRLLRGSGSRRASARHQSSAVVTAAQLECSSAMSVV